MRWWDAWLGARSGRGLDDCLGGSVGGVAKPIRHDPAPCTLAPPGLPLGALAGTLGLPSSVAEPKAYHTACQALPPSRNPLLFSAINAKHQSNSLR